MSITKDFVVQQGALIKGTNAVTSSTGQTSALQINGGAAVAKNLVVGTTATIWGSQTNKSSLTVEGVTILQNLSAQVTTATDLTVTGKSLFSGNTQFNGALNTFSGALIVTGSNVLIVGTGTASFGGLVTVAGQTLVTNNTLADWVGDQAALEVTGGAIIGDKLYVKSTAHNSNSKYDNAIYTPGGIWTDGGLTVGTGAPTLFKGPVTFAGTASYVYSTNTVYTDNLINVHVPPGGNFEDHTWTLDDGKDIGFVFHYYKTSDKNAFLGFANDTGYLEWYSEGNEVGSVFTGTTYGIFKTGGIRLVGGQSNSGNTSTGDLQVLGGVGVAGGMYVGGVLTATNFSGSLSGGTANQLVYQSAANTTAFLNTGTSGQFLQAQTNGAPIWTSTGTMYVNSAVYAQNIYGGATGSLLYQSLPNATTSLPIGTNGFILSVVGGAPAWVSAGALSAGIASTATNIAGGAANQIPYQSSAGNTVFSSNLTFNGTTFTTTNIVVSGTTNSTSTTTGAVVVAGGVGIAKDLYVGGDVNIDGTLFLKGVGVTDVTGTTGTFDFVILKGTGTGLTVYDQAVIGNGTTNHPLVQTHSTSTGALQVKGGVGVWGGIFASGAITGTNINAVSNATVGGTLGVTGYATLSGGATLSAATVTNNLLVSGAATVTGYTSLNGGATLSAATVTNTLAVTGYASLNGGATLSAATVTNTLAVTGYASLNGGATLSAATVTNNLLVSGAATVTGYTSLNGGATLSAATVTNTLAVTGYASLNGGATLSAATVTNTLLVSGYATLNGGATLSAATVTNNLLVSGSATVTGQSFLNGGTTTTNFTATTANITGNQTVGGTLTVTGYTSLNGGATLSAATVTNNLLVSGSATVSTNLRVTGLFTATGASTFGSTVGITGITSITNTTDSTTPTNGALIVSGGVGVAKNLNVGGAITVGVTTASSVVNALYSNNMQLSSYTSGSISGTTQTNLDTFDALTYRTAKYVIQIVDVAKVHVTEILLFHDGTDVYSTEYATFTNQGELGTFDATLAANTVTLKFTPTGATSMVIKVTRQLITG